MEIELDPVPSSEPPLVIPTDGGRAVLVFPAEVTATVYEGPHRVRMTVRIDPDGLRPHATRLVIDSDDRSPITTKWLGSAWLEPALKAIARRVVWRQDVVAESETATAYAGWTDTDANLTDEEVEVVFRTRRKQVSREEVEKVLAAYRVAVAEDLPNPQETAGKRVGHSPSTVTRYLNQAVKLGLMTQEERDESKKRRPR